MAASNLEFGGGRRTGILLALAVAVGCSTPPEPAPAPVAGNWSVTTWGKHYEVYPEVEPLVVGQTAVAHTHVTRLDGFAPLVDGGVDIVLSGAAGEQVFSVESATGPGIFTVEIAPGTPGDFELSFRIRGPEGSEEIRGGKVRVGTGEQPGGLIVAPAPRGATDGGEALGFLKEEQWRSDFATAWVRSGKLSRSVAGLARLRPPAGGDVAVTTPVDGVLRPGSGSRSWPFVGQRVERGSALFQVVPRVAAERSLAVLEADLAALAAELETARTRLSRLEELLELEAVSQREVEDVRARVQTLEARHAAADRDLASARSAREGGSTGNVLSLRAPIAGSVAGVSVTPGATVAAGEALARLVRTDAVWIEVSASPAGARQIATEGVRGVVLSGPEHGSTRIEEGVRLISVAPELTPGSGTVTVILEVPASSQLVPGTTLDALVLCDQEREGIVIPASALVDDGGVAVVYLQLAGERFIRQEVRVVERQGNLLRVANLVPGQRLVSSGGDAIRRSSLMASGSAHGHVH